MLYTFCTNVPFYAHAMSFSLDKFGGTSYNHIIAKL